MATTEMNCLACGGGGFEVGTVTVTTGTETFSWQSISQKPSKFILYKVSNPAQTGDMIHLYDEDMLTSSAQLYVYASGGWGGGTGSVPSTTDDIIQDLTASGFSLKTSSSTWSGTYVYIAIL